MIGWRRLTAGGGLALCALLLAGCRVEGTVDVVAAGEVTIDLLLVGDEATCDVSVQTPRLAYTKATDATGAEACRVTGTLRPEDLQTLDLVLVDAGEYLLFRTGGTEDRSGWPDGSITFRFAGDVIRASQGTVAGNTVLIGELPALSDGIEVVALNRAGPPDRVLWAGLGAAGGATLALGGLIVLRGIRNRRAAGASTPSEAVPPGDPGPVVAVPLTDPGQDTTWLAVPAAPAELPATNEPGRPPSGPAPDHSVWAPTSDH